MEVKPKKCKNPECNKMFTPRYSTLEKYCSPKCGYACVKPNERKISRVSPKREKEERQYSKDRKEFLSRPENTYCFIIGCHRRANTIEHTRGRSGYADEWARNEGITLYLDQRFWEPCCIQHNLQLENDPELSREHQLSKIHGGKKEKK